MQKKILLKEKYKYVGKLQKLHYPLYKNTWIASKVLEIKL